MDDEKMQAIAEGVLENLLAGGDVLEVEEFPPEPGRGRRWRIRLLPGTSDTAGG